MCFPILRDWISLHIYIINRPEFFTAIKNSVINTFDMVFFAVMISALSAYGFARIRFPGREIIFKIYC